MIVRLFFLTVTQFNNNMSRKLIKIDQTFDKLLKEHVSKDSRRTLCLSVRGSQVVISGEKDSVELAVENGESMTVFELLEVMKRMDQDQEEEAMRYKSTERVVFPPMEVKFKGQLWTAQKARGQLNLYLNILGFGKTGTKRFKDPTDEPNGWPEEHSFEAFGHPSHANVNVVNDVLESILCYHGYDAKTHPYIAEEPEVPPLRKRKRQWVQRRRKKAAEEDDNDPNDNSLDMEPDEGGESEESNSKNKRKKSNSVEAPYVHMMS